MMQIIVIAHNLRSTHNVGSLLRTAEGLGVDMVYFTGYTPYPSLADDSRMPHIANKLHNQIHKTALGAEETQPWKHSEDITPVLTKLKNSGFTLCALEQAPHSISLPEFAPPEKIALVLGREVEGLEKELLAQVSTVLEIPMKGKKESFNVVQAAAMALYHCRFFGNNRT